MTKCYSDDCDGTRCPKHSSGGDTYIEVKKTLN